MLFFFFSIRVTQSTIESSDYRRHTVSLRPTKRIGTPKAFRSTTVRNRDIRWRRVLLKNTDTEPIKLHVIFFFCIYFERRILFSHIMTANCFIRLGVYARAQNIRSFKIKRSNVVCVCFLQNALFQNWIESRKKKKTIKY